MTGFVTNLEEQTLTNQSFRKVLYTAAHGQVVVMSLLPNEEIGMEVHTVDQFFRIEKGQVKVIMNGEENIVSDGFAILVPAGTQHNIINTSATDRVQLYTIYMPAQHRDGVEHVTKAEGEADQTDHV